MIRRALRILASAFTPARPAALLSEEELRRYRSIRNELTTCERTATARANQVHDEIEALRAKAQARAYRRAKRIVHQHFEGSDFPPESLRDYLLDSSA